MDMQTNLIPINARPLATVFDDPDAMNKVLAQIQRAALAETADPETEEGRASIKSLAYKVSRSKTALEDVGKPLADAARVQYDKLNAVRKTAKEFLDALRDAIRKPLADWEEVEKQRIEALEDRLTAITAMGEIETYPSDVVERIIGHLDALEIGDDWEEFAEKAAEEKAIILEYLCRELKARVAAEAEQAELETLRAEKLEREAQDAERAREEAIKLRERTAAENARRQATIDAEAALEREKDKNQREFDRAQREVFDANLRAEQAADVERQRIDAERAAENEARDNRIADETHRNQVMDGAVHALMVVAPVPLTVLQADQIIFAIDAGKIPHVTINF